MPDFSTIMQTPDVRALVQENLLERAFHDALFPRLLFRGECTPQQWPANVGDNMVFTGVGLIPPKMAPLPPGVDPAPSGYQTEQWSATLQQYADTIDTHIPTSAVAIANLFLRNAQQMGLSAGMALNRLARNKLYNVGMSGNTNATALGNTSTSLPVARLCGFTRARRPDLTTGSPVAFSPVSANNPLAITIGTSTAAVVTGYTATISGGEVGPGTLTLQSAKSWSARDRVVASDASVIVRSGGGTSMDALVAANVITLADIRSAVARFWQQNVPELSDGRFHIHLSPSAQGELFADVEFGRLLTALPDHYTYRQFAMGEMLGCVFFRNAECPIPQTVTGGLTAAYDPNDMLGLELYKTGATTGIQIQHTLVLGAGAVFEYYQDQSILLTEAGVAGRVGEPRITNNGIEVSTDRIQLIIRQPQNRLQDMVATSWRFVGDWPSRTDATVGDAARFKRAVVIEHA